MSPLLLSKLFLWNTNMQLRKVCYFPFIRNEQIGTENDKSVGATSPVKQMLAEFIFYPWFSVSHNINISGSYGEGIVFDIQYIIKNKSSM